MKIVSGIPLPIYVVANHKSDGDRFDVRRFYSICLHEELLELCNHNGIRGIPRLVRVFDV